MSRLTKLVATLSFSCINFCAQAGYVVLENINASLTNSGYSNSGCFNLSAINSGSCSYTYTPNGLPDTSTFGASTYSFGDIAGLHAQASASLTTGYSGYVIAEAQVKLSDTLTFDVAPFTTGFVSMTFTTDGGASGGNTPGFVPNAPPGAGYGFSSLSLDSFNTCSYYNAGTCTVTLAVDLYNPLTIGTLLSANAFPYASDGSDTEYANFQNTGFISSLEFTDSNGDPLPLSYTSSEGLTYPMPQSVTGVPEPDSLLLLLAGMSVLGVVMRRQPRRL